jgi:solute carrier family 25 carnitine/acylcarnitine transporter 20/29
MASVVDMLKLIHDHGGLKRLWRGTGLTILRDFPGDAAYFVTFEAVRRTLMGLSEHGSDGPRQFNPLVTLAAGGGFNAFFCKFEVANLFLML